MKFALLLALPCFAQTLAIESATNLKYISLKGEAVTYKGKKAVRITDSGQRGLNDGPGADRTVAIVPGTDFSDGTIEVELSGEPGPGAAGAARGFVGVAFRVSADAEKFECFYLRPTNGRADDQIRRNHSVQYISSPGFPWQRLRKEFPEKYESYVDLVPAEWTKVKIVVKGETAKLYVHGNDQPTLIVNDLKQGASKGAIALWSGPGTVAHFANLRVSQ